MRRSLIAPQTIENLAEPIERPQQIARGARVDKSKPQGYFELCIEL